MAAVAYDPTIFDAVCEHIASGKSLREIARIDGMPATTTIIRWLAAPENDAMRAQYARAREAQADAIFDEILEIADDGTNDWVTRQRSDGSTYEAFEAEHVQRSRLRIDARKWMAAKLRPKVYGDKLELDGNVGITVVLEKDAGDL